MDLRELLKRRSIVLATVGIGTLVSVAAGATAMPRPERAGPSDAPEIIQLSALRDDEPVTPVQLEGEIEAYKACGEAAGYTPLVLPGDGQRPTRVGFSIPEPGGVPNNATVAESRERLAECAAELDAVSSAAAAQRGEPSAEELVALYDRLEACVAVRAAPSAAPAFPFSEFAVYRNAPARDVEVGPGGVEAYAACAVELQAETGLLSPPAGGW